MPVKDEDIEQTVPTEWRLAIVEIVEDIRNRNLRPKNGSGYEIEVDSAEIEDIYLSVDHYGDALVSLPQDAWQTSVCRWMGRYWHVLIDLLPQKRDLAT